MKEERDIKKWVQFDTVTKEVILYYKVISNVELNGIKFTVETNGKIDFNLITQNIEEFRDKILEVYQSVVIEHQKKMVQLQKNIELLDELGFKIA